MCKKKAVQIILNMPHKLYEHLDLIGQSPYMLNVESVESIIIKSMNTYVDTFVSTIRKEMGEKEFKDDDVLVQIAKERRIKREKITTNNVNDVEPRRIHIHTESINSI
jgi:hypothetical protein